MYIIFCQMKSWIMDWEYRNNEYFRNHKLPQFTVRNIMLASRFHNVWTCRTWYVKGKKGRERKKRRPWTAPICFSTLACISRRAAASSSISFNRFFISSSSCMITHHAPCTNSHRHLLFITLFFYFYLYIETLLHSTYILRWKWRRLPWRRRHHRQQTCQRPCLLPSLPRPGSHHRTPRALPPPSLLNSDSTPIILD